MEISAELPGLTSNDVNVEIDNDVLVIRGERKSEHETTEGEFTEANASTATSIGQCLSPKERVPRARARNLRMEYCA